MARRLIWTERAAGDLLDLLDWVRRDAPLYALRIEQRFRNRAAHLPGQPGQGRRLPEHDGPEEVRGVFVHRWRLIYEVTDDAVTILAIVHGARLLHNADPL